MKILHRCLPWVAGLILATVPAVGFADPPADVDVIDGDADDFFAPPAPARPAGNEAVRQRADDLFEELEREERRHGKAPARVELPSDPDASVVDVEVGTPPTPPAPVAAPAPPAPPPPVSQVQSKPKRGWWNRPSHPEEGQLLVFLTGGSYDAGGFIGIGGEAMASDRLGIRMVSHFAGFGSEPPGSGFSRNFNFFDGGWAIAREVSPKTASGGYAHLTDLTLAVHLFPRSMLDAYATAGASHFGYSVDFRDGTEKGGAGYVRLGGGLNVHLKRFFGGFDFGWYPLEVFRYSMEKRNREHEAEFEPIEDRTNASRFTFTAQVGMRF